jgi:hypothetical protein
MSQATQTGVELSSRIFEEMQSSEEKRQSEIRAANQQAQDRARHLTRQIVDVEEIEGVDPANLPFEMVSLFALMPDILAKKKAADRVKKETGETIPIGPIEYQSGAIRHYAGALLIASQALDQPVRAKAGESTALIDPGDTPEVALETCRQLWSLPPRESD